MSSTVFDPADLDKDGKVTKKELNQWNALPDKKKVSTADVTRMGEKYGYAAAYLAATPELFKILQSLLLERVTDPDVIRSRIENSDWFQSFEKSYIEADKRRKSNPTVWGTEVNTVAKTIMERFRDAGANIDEVTAREYAEKFLLGSSGSKTSGTFEFYDEKWLDRIIGSSIDFSRTKTINGVTFYDLSGSAEQNAEALYKLAYEYGMDTSMSNTAFTSWFENAVRRVVTKESTMEDMDDELIESAISRFPGLAPQIQRGLTLRGAADPYLKAIAETLELDGDSLDFNDNLVQSILNSQDEKGNHKAMSLYQAKLAARSDPRWKYTSTAKKSYTDIAGTILKDFGFLG